MSGGGIFRDCGERCPARGSVEEVPSAAEQGGLRTRASTTNDKDAV